MEPSLKPSEALSQVVFIHDYIQLIFQHEGFNIYNVSEVVQGNTVCRHGAHGFCDALVSLIDRHVTSVSIAAPYKLLLTFDRGFQFRVLSGNDYARGPEAFEFFGPNGLTAIIEQNA